ncbi:MAG: Gfo/Idh/MocA family oxidoreductase, partial [Anaerolineae bacterium]|nr:Gfo/Idh/MocA family oxidoreductase [Anaerolineae bacterium]
AQAGVVLMAAHNQRFIRLHQAVKALIESGSLGQPYLAHAVFGHGGPENWSPSQDWYFRPDQGGHGVLADLGAHKFDLLSWLLDQRIVEVGAMAHTFEKPAATIDTVACTLRFSGDTLATVQLSWTFRPDWENSLVIRCARGVVRVPTDASASAEALIVDKDGGQRLLSLDGSADDSAGWLATVAAFCAAVEQGAPSPVSGEDGRAVVAALDAAFEALSSRRVVPVG